MQADHKPKGFTLVELSIVLIIIGLIISGVVAGKNLIEMSTMRAILNDISKIQGNYNTFVLKYDAIPGDMINASDYFPDCTAATGQNFCDGDGNGLIKLPWGGGVNKAEPIRAIEHLYRSGIWKNINITAPGSRYDGRIGENLPEMPITGGGYSFGRDESGYLPGWARYNAKNYITMGSENTTLGGTANGSVMDPIFTMLQAYQIDSKLDDGFKNSGQVFTERGNENPAICGSLSGHTANYDLSVDGAQCSMFVQLDQ